MADSLSVAAVQFEMRPVQNFETFAQHISAALDEAGNDARVVVLPELLTSGLFAASEGWESDSLAQFDRIADFAAEYENLLVSEARSRDQWILGGSTLLRTENGLENIALLVSPHGDVHHHSKSHIFPAEGEWNTVEGNSFATYEIDGVRVGIAICYEIEIPEVATILSRQGAEVILVPSYTFTEAGFYRVRHCAAARAIENQVYVVHCPTTGELPSPLSAGWGRPSILSPCDLEFPADGVIAEGETNRQSTVRATLDLVKLRENRESGAATTFHDRQRRSSLYDGYRQFLY